MINLPTVEAFLSVPFHQDLPRDDHFYSCRSKYQPRLETIIYVLADLTSHVWEQSFTFLSI